MVRAAAKNHERVAIVTDPDDYACVIEELRSADGSLSANTRRALAGRAFAHTAAYDAAIADYLAARIEPDAPMPSRFGLVGQRLHPLRYGENPHQPAAVYRVGPANAPGSLVDAEQLHGKELSFNNLVDAAAAMEVVGRLAALPSGTRRVAAAVIKHTNPCGAAVAPDAGDAVEHAIAGDPLAAFGGIIAVGALIDARAAEVLTGPDRFLEVVIAPAFEDDALAMLRARWKTVRLLAVPGLGEAPAGESGQQTAAVRLRQIPGGFVAQHADTRAPTPASWEHHAGPVPEPGDLELGAFAEACAASLTSNAIAIAARDGDALRLVGGGAGQMDRVTACRLAIEKAGARVRGAVAASDAFFPFDDGPRLLIDAGVRVIVHPGGSRRDGDTFALCDEHGVTCLVTGVRRFRH
ncbi:MAG: bifunctional phosphoribosylaminoimidazolecarboxamide formyltransferase/IMP cyclohydrolase [Phycisphaerales bacterium JB037]